jgi:hypothetical protein
MRDTGFDRFPNTREVDVDHVLPVVFAGLVEGRPAVADAGVRNDDVESAQLFDAAVHNRRQRVEVAHVHLGGDDAPVEVLDEVGGFGEVIGCGPGDVAAGDSLADIDGDDVGALLGQAHSMAAALTARCAADERNFALNSSTHGATSFPRTPHAHILVDRPGS